MKSLVYPTRFGEEIEVLFATNHYSDNGNLYVGMIFENEDGFFEPWSNVTVNLGIILDKEFAYVDENNNPGISEWLEKNNLGKRTGDIKPNGWCKYPLFRFNISNLQKYVFTGNL